MKLKFFYISILFLSSLSLSFAQGFDWQYSARLPQKQPKLFIGVLAGGSYSYEMASFKFTEELIPCCDFSDGSGLNILVGAAGQYWFSDGISALTFSAGYNLTQSKFTVQQEVPTVDYLIIYEYSYKGSNSYVVINSMYKRRLFSSHFSVSGGFDISLLLNQSDEYNEEIISPSDEFFSDGSRERIISKGEIAPLRTFIVNPVFALGYDINLGKSKYAELQLFSDIPIMHSISNESWRHWEVGLKLNILFGKRK